MKCVLVSEQVQTLISPTSQGCDLSGFASVRGGLFPDRFVFPNMLKEYTCSGGIGEQKYCCPKNGNCIFLSLWPHFSLFSLSLLGLQLLFCYATYPPIYPALPPAVPVFGPQGVDPKAGGHSGHRFACLRGKLGVHLPFHQVRSEL